MENSVSTGVLVVSQSDALLSDIEQRFVDLFRGLETVKHNVDSMRADERTTSKERCRFMFVVDDIKEIAEF